PRPFGDGCVIRQNDRESFGNHCVESFPFEDAVPTADPAFRRRNRLGRDGTPRDGFGRRWFLTWVLRWAGCDPQSHPREPQAGRAGSRRRPDAAPIPGTGVLPFLSRAFDNDGLRQALVETRTPMRKHGLCSEW